jgi:hypothetical protein
LKYSNRAIPGKPLKRKSTEEETLARKRKYELRMILFINNTENTFYETKVLKKKHVSFLKYIYNALLISYKYKYKTSTEIPSG